MLKGIVKWYNHRRGTGLIEGLNDGMIVGFDRASVAAGSIRFPCIGDLVEFILPDSGKRIRALFVRVVNPAGLSKCWPKPSIARAGA